MSKTRRGRPPAAHPKTKQIWVRITDEDEEYLDALAAKFPGFHRSDVLRAAMRLGASTLDVAPNSIVKAGALAEERVAWLRQIYPSESE